MEQTEIYDVISLEVGTYLFSHYTILSDIPPQKKCIAGFKIFESRNSY